MKFQEACKKAMNYLKTEYGDVGFCSIMDLGEKWLFDGTDAGQNVVYGKPGITINKNTGKLELFHLPDTKNFELLDGAVEIVVPEEHKILT